MSATDGLNLRNIGKLAGLQGAALLLSFLQTFVLVRLFGAQAFGEYALLLSTISILILFAAFGQDQLMLRTLAANGHSKTSGFYRRAGLCLMGVLALLTVGLALPGGNLANTILVTAIIALPIQLTRRFSEARLQARFRVAPSQVSSKLVFPTLMICGAVLLATPIGPQITLFNLFLTSLMVSAVLAIVLNLRLLKSDGAAPAPDLQAPFRAGFFLTATALGAMLGKHIDALMIGILARPQDVALVRISFRFAELVLVLRLVALLVARPMLARAGAMRDRDQLARIARLVSLGSLAGGVPILAAAWAFAPQILDQLGLDPVEGTFVFRAYLLSGLVILLCGPAQAILEMTGQEGVAARILWYALPLNLIIDLVLIPQIGVAACGLANLTCTVLTAVWMARSLHRATGLDTSVLQFLPRIRRYDTARST